MKKILCESNPMCYGSSTVLLSIIENLIADTFCLAFGIAKEILEKGKTEIIEVNNKSTKDVESAIKNLDFDIVLVISNTSNLNLYKSLNKRIYFVHIHYFYPNMNKEFNKLINVFFIQKFWNLQEIRTASKVGPLIKSPKEKNKTKKLILVNFGGGESRFIQPGINSNYGKLMLNLIIKLKPNFKNKKIIICGGKKIINTIKQKANDNNITALTLSNDDYLGFLNESEILISSPGLNAIFEAIYREIPVVFLPPQNVSQVYQLKEYEKANLCYEGLNVSYPDSSFREEEQTKQFLEEMELTFHQSHIFQKQLNCLSEQLEYIKTEEYSKSVNRAKEFLGEIGTDQISKIINHDYI